MSLTPHPPMLDSEREADRRKLARTRWFGAVLIPVSLIWSWYFLWQPLQQAQHTGQIEYSLRAVLLGPLIFYMGVALLVADMRDSNMRTFDAQGGKRRTRKAWIFIAGAVVVAGLTLAGWIMALHRLGLSSGL